LVLVLWIDEWIITKLSKAINQNYRQRRLLFSIEIISNSIHGKHTPYQIARLTNLLRLASTSSSSSSLLLITKQHCLIVVVDMTNQYFYCSVPFHYYILYLPLPCVRHIIKNHDARMILCHCTVLSRLLGENTRNSSKMNESWIDHGRARRIEKKIAEERSWHGRLL